MKTESIPEHIIVFKVKALPRTLKPIAKSNKFNTTVEDLKTLNNLTNNNLSIGQVLRIPN